MKKLSMLLIEETNNNNDIFNKVIYLILAPKFQIKHLLL
jgi:hypothetical protein